MFMTVARTQSTLVLGRHGIISTRQAKAFVSVLDTSGTGCSLSSPGCLLLLFGHLRPWSWKDGNGVVNFGEFAAWAGPRLGLELGEHGKLMMCISATSPRKPDCKF